MVNKLLILYKAILGYFYKWLIEAHILQIPDLRNRDSERTDIIVSLTSYGRRVYTGVVYFTLVSLLRQSIQPRRIILWLAEDEWNDNNLPKKLASLRSNGVEIHYCEDIRSYKKLIPTLELCPNDCIMTVDDDIIYSSDTIRKVYEQHKEYPNDIIAFNASQPLIYDGIPSKYATWHGISREESGKIVFPVGAGGTLYPARSLHKDVTDKELFTKLCPLADDIWFWFCGLRNGTNKRFITKKGTDYSFDALYQYFHKGSALTHTNRFEHANDKQFRDLFNYYGVRIDEEGNLIKL